MDLGLDGGVVAGGADVELGPQRRLGPPLAGRRRQVREAHVLDVGPLAVRPAERVICRPEHERREQLLPEAIPRERPRLPEAPDAVAVVDAVLRRAPQPRHRPQHPVAVEDLHRRRMLASFDRVTDQPRRYRVDPAADPDPAPLPHPGIGTSCVLVGPPSVRRHARLLLSCISTSSPCRQLLPAREHTFTSFRGPTHEHLNGRRPHGLRTACSLPWTTPFKACADLSGCEPPRCPCSFRARVDAQNRAPRGLCPPRKCGTLPRLMTRRRRRMEPRPPRRTFWPGPETAPSDPDSTVLWNKLIEPTDHGLHL